MNLRTIIVEDEPLSKQYISSLLNRFPEVEVVAKATTEEEAIRMIHTLQPDLIFLDIELHTGTGFEVLKQLDQLNFTVIFTTALDHLALKMIRLSGVLFLQKPIDAEELEVAIKKIGDEKNTFIQQSALHHLLDTLHNKNTPVHIAIQPNGVLEYIVLSHLIRIESVGDNTVLFLENGATKQSDTSIKDYENLLVDFYFFRVAAMHLVNLKQVKEVAAELVLMKEGNAVPLSSKKRNELFLKLKVMKVENKR